VSGIPVSACEACGWQGFPRRIWCPACGADQLEEREAERGVVEDETTLRRAAGRRLEAASGLGTVLLDGGGRAVARLHDAAPGDRVAVSFERGAPSARRER